MKLFNTTMEAIERTMDQRIRGRTDAPGGEEQR